MSLEKVVSKQLREYQSDPGYQTEMLSLHVTEEIVRLMDAKGVSKADLARLLGVSKARVTRLLTGSPNLTVKTIATVATVLGSETRVTIRPWEASQKGARPETRAHVASKHAFHHQSSWGFQLALWNARPYDPGQGTSLDVCRQASLPAVTESAWSGCWMTFLAPSTTKEAVVDLQTAA